MASANLGRTSQVEYVSLCDWARHNAVVAALVLQQAEGRVADAAVAAAGEVRGAGAADVYGLVNKIWQSKKT